MKTSRLDGILVLQTDKPYEIAISGKMEQRNTIICRDINAKTENAACDLEQALMTAMMTLQGRETKEISKAQMAKDEKAEKDFFKNDSPKMSDIDAQAQAIEMIVNMASGSVRKSQLKEMFYEIACERLACDGDLKLTQSVWDTISLKDKNKIMFRYCAFFVNPFEAVSDMASSTEKKG